MFLLRLVIERTMAEQLGFVESPSRPVSPKSFTNSILSDLDTAPRSAEEVQQFVDKVKVYAISDQVSAS
jgi:hypothetical protein